MKISNFKFQIFLGLLVFFLFPAQGSAHVLKVDGSIGVTVHIDPDDAPVAKKANTIFVSIKDRDKQFDEKNPVGCDCTLQVVKGEKVIDMIPVTTEGSYNTLQYVFPSSGTYTLLVSGKPNGKSSAFQPFITSYEYYVQSSDSTAVDKTNRLLIYLPYLSLVAGVLILFMFLNPFANRK
jgi:hypothetical protein